MDREILRVFLFLEAVRAVFQGRACYTIEAAAYMGVGFRFPTLQESDQ